MAKVKAYLIITGKGRNTEDHDIIPKRKGILKANVLIGLLWSPYQARFSRLQMLTLSMAAVALFMYI